MAACGGDDDTSPATEGSGGGAGMAGNGAMGSGGAGGGDSGGGGAGGGGGMTAGGDAQTPPQGATALEAWLATGVYKQWDCEPEPHAARSPSPHGFNRICTNSAIAVNAAGTDDWPVGAAAVKEIFESATDTAPIGYAVYLKTKADSAGGANWYWYEGQPGHADVVIDGMGDSGLPMTVCVGCHSAAGADAAHLPTPGGRDQVYTPVP